ncbi:MAG: prephenate dehydrogenase [Gemmataceae bacterium]|nr:prephenate dehydrogenase [Gemmataceae bacterium]
MDIDTLTIVGVGLIGGSIGLAAKRRGLARRVIGVGRQRGTLDDALAVGAIDIACLDAASAVHQSQVTVFCTPVDRIVEQVVALAPGCRPDALLTDAGSTKGTIVGGIEAKLCNGVAFVGSHPLAGSEKRGPLHAKEDLFQNRVTVVTRTPRTSDRALERTMEFWQALGSRVRVMTPDEHDRALAMTSHLPHLLASALAGVLPVELYDLAATGFRDTTRIAAGDPALWTGIFAQNRQAVLDSLDLLQDRLTQFKQALQTDDQSTLDSLLAEAKRTRDALGS